MRHQSFTLRPTARECVSINLRPSLLSWETVPREAALVNDAAAPVVDAQASASWMIN